MASRVAGRHVSGKDPVERFYSFTERNEATGCLEWIGAINSRGYGCFSYGGRSKVVLAHRWVVEYVRGEEIPTGMTVHHKCYNTRCVELDHLQVMSRGENSSHYFTTPESKAMLEERKAANKVKREAKKAAHSAYIAQLTKEALAAQGGVHRGGGGY